MKYSLQLLLVVSAIILPCAGSERIVNYASPKTVYDILFERNYAWFATSGGLLRVDLTDGKQWGKASDETFPDPTVKALALDSKGRVWAGTKNGYLLRIDQNGSEYLNLSYVSAQWAITDMIAYGPFLIIGSDKGVSLFDTRKNIVVKNSSRIGSFTSSSVNIVKIFNNRLYIGCELGFAVLEGTLDSIEEDNFYDPSIWDIDSSVDFSVNALVKDSTGVIRAFRSPAGYSNNALVTTDTNSVTMHLRDTVVTTYLPSNVTCMSIMNGNQMWIGTQSDFYFFWGDGFFVPFVLAGPSFSGVSRITVDNDGALWVMPFGEPNYPVTGENCPWWLGINRFDGYEWKVYSPKEYPQMGHMGFQAEALGLLKDRRGNLWFGFSGGGIKRYNPAIDDWYHYCNYGKNYGNGIFLRTQGACPDIDWGKCDAFAQDSNGYIWISSWNNYSGALICYKPDVNFHDSLYGIYDSLAGEFKRFPPNGYGEAGVEISAIAADASGNILYGTVKGLVSVFRYNGNPFTSKLQTVKEFPNLPKILHINVVPDGSSLVLTAGGVYRFDPSDHSLKYLDDFDKNITALSLESENIYWYGTSSSGLVRYDLKNNEKAYYNQASGFVSNQVNDVVVDNKNGRVWIASDHGVSQLVLGYNISASGKGAEIVFPNPFSLRRHTIMQFQNLPADGTLRVYTLDGTLAGKPEVVRSGDHGAYFSWTPPRSCSPGTYFYSFVSSGVKSSGRILIIP